MMVVRDNKYNLVRAANGLIECRPVGCNQSIYTESCKYIDTRNNVVLIIDARRGKCEPTYGTLRRVDNDKVHTIVDSIRRQLNVESI